MRKLMIVSVMILVLVSIFPSKSVHADIAPPEAPPGTNLVPGNETTQVRMMAETVTLTISKSPSNPRNAVAKTEAVFTMRNLGTAEEKMAVRFPLSFFNGNSNGFGVFPEIPSIDVRVNGETVPTKRENQPPIIHQEGAHPMPIPEREEVPWAVFDVSFPPNQDVIIEVVYTVNGYGSYPYESFKYILETGAGWKDTIDSAEIVVRMPYEATTQNIDLSGQTGYGGTTEGAVFTGNEIRWHFEGLEPTPQDNMQIIIISPLLWESVLRETDNVTRNPNDGEAWGRLAKAYKEVSRMPKGYLREDPAGREMFELSKSAYEKCLALLPKDSLWQYGYADLLWPHYYFDIYSMGKEDAQGILPTILRSLQIALELDPNNQQAKDLLTEISYAIPDAVSLEVDAGIFTLLGLTATPIPPTPYLIPTETPFPTLTEIPPTREAIATATSSQPATPNPLCGSAFLLPVFLSVVFFLKKNKTL